MQEENGNELEAKCAELEQKMSSGSTNHEELMEWGREVEKLSNEIDGKTLRWIELSE